jgi:hypothetical protein
MPSSGHASPLGCFRVSQSYFLITRLKLVEENQVPGSQGKQTKQDKQIKKIDQSHAGRVAAAGFT